MTKDEQIKSLQEVAETLHRISASMDVKYMLAKGVKNEILRASLSSKLMLDSAVKDEAADAFEKVVILLKDLGDPTAIVRECKAEDIVVPPGYRSHFEYEMKKDLDADEVATAEKSR